MIAKNGKGKEDLETGDRSGARRGENTILAVRGRTGEALRTAALKKSIR